LHRLPDEQKSAGTAGFRASDLLFSAGRRFGLSGRSARLNANLVFDQVGAELSIVSIEHERQDRDFTLLTPRYQLESIRKQRLHHQTSFVGGNWSCCSALMSKRSVIVQSGMPMTFEGWLPWKNNTER
jgi:hypothetical protein